MIESLKLLSHAADCLGVSIEAVIKAAMDILETRKDFAKILAAIHSTSGGQIIICDEPDREAVEDLLAAMARSYSDTNISSLEFRVERIATITNLTSSIKRIRSLYIDDYEREHREASRPPCPLRIQATRSVAIRGARGVIFQPRWSHKRFGSTTSKTHQGRK
jgi:hypothetical protein